MGAEQNVEDGRDFDPDFETVCDVYGEHRGERDRGDGVWYCDACGAEWWDDEDDDPIQSGSQEGARP